MWPLLLVACDVQYQTVDQERILDSYAYVDAGAVTVGESHAFTVPLFSQAYGDVRVFDIVTDVLSQPDGQVGAPFSVVAADWAAAGCDRDGDGTADCRDLTGYAPESDSDTWPLALTFLPEVEGYFEGLVTIWSNDSVTQETAPLPGVSSGEEYGIWRVQLRGLARYACGQVFPTYYDFGKRTANGDFSTEILVQNCGVVLLTLSAIDVVETDSMASLTQTPLYVLPGGNQGVTVGWHVPPDTDGLPTASAGTAIFTSTSNALTASSVRLIGNNCPASSSRTMDADSDGFSYCNGDCDDTRVDINPSVPEIAGDLVDNDCDSAVDEAANPEDSDDDGDGCSETGAGDGCPGRDCDDADATVSPFVPETRNGIDDDCNGLIDDTTDGYDDDVDSHTELSGDCDDANPLVYPGAEESPTDLVDNDCDGLVDEGGTAVDDDQDGFADVEADTTHNDCDDRDPWVYVGAREYCDGYDNDCDAVADEGNVDDDGGLDAAGGACAFLPTRETLTSDDAATKAEDTGCTSGSTLPNLVSACLACLGTLVRRRARD